MSRSLLNDNQQRRLSTHVQLLVSDLEALAESAELRRDGAAFTRVRDAIDARRRTAEAMRTALSLAPDRTPSLGRRIMALAEMWAARIEDLRARRLMSYGAVHPALAECLDPRVEDLRSKLDALAAAAAGLTEGDA